MSERKTPWTPGPWRTNGLVIVDPETKVVTVLNDGNPTSGSNARLIAAAPEMAELLDRFSRAPHPRIGLLNEARALLARIGAP